MRPQRRDLRTGLTLWEADGLPYLPHRPLNQSIETDVVIVGAGISGALMADMLAESGLRVVVVDRRGPVRGSTVASSALLLFEIDTPLITLAERIGQPAAERVWLRSADAVTDLARRIKKADISCAWHRRDSLYLAVKASEAEELAREAAARRRIGLSAQLIDRKTLRRKYGIDRPVAIRSRHAAEVDPVRLASGLLRRAMRHGALLLAPVDIASVTASPRGVVARSKNGCTIAAAKLIFATGYEAARRVPYRGHRILSTWAMATAPQPKNLWPSRCLMWETAQPYLFIRSTPDGRVVAGGEDEDIADEARRDALIGRKTRAIARKLKALLPDLDVTPEFAWAGSFGDSVTGMPTIGPVPAMPNCYAVLGYGGNGITFSMIAAQLLNARISGRRDPDADLFGFDRKPL
jgi:glycine/D-amino acid oxidase-like deaminating enzyme